MTQYNSLNVKLSNSQLNELKSAIKNETEVILRLSPNMIGGFNDEDNFPHKLLLTDRQVSDIRKAFSNNSSANIKFSKTQLSKMIQSGGISRQITWSFIKNWITVDKKCNYATNKKCINSLRINCSSISSRCKNT